MSKFVGKYVCYGREDGTFCWGRIESENEVNSVHGPKKVFILTERITCSLPAWVERHSVISGPIGKPRATIVTHAPPSDKVKLVVRHHKRRTTLRKEEIDLERDIIDRDGLGLEGMEKDALFLLIMTRKIEEMPGLNQGGKNILKSEVGDMLRAFVDEEVKQELRERLGIQE